jgi:ParB-like chromosome segregation protein Spo0J
MPQHPAPPVDLAPIDKLFCSPTNPRQNDASIPHVAASLRRFGWQQPVVARRTGEVIAGNTRRLAAQHLGMTEVPVWWFDGTDLDAVAYAVADNKKHEFAQWDEAALARLLEQLRAEDSLEGVGFDDEEISRLIAGLAAEESADLDDPGAEPPPAVSVAKPGDLWILGNHRLLCGDSTHIADVHRVRNGKAAALVETDPPHLVECTGERPNDSGKD